MGVRLLERDAELAALEDALGRAISGAGAVVLVSGEAGIGKTDLVRAFLRSVGARARVLTGACDDLLALRTWGPLRDMVLEPPPGPLAAALGRGDREAVFGAVVEEVSAGPTVLVVEDAHWADEATLDVLRHLGRRVHDRPAMLVVTYRDDELSPGHPLRHLLGGLAGDAVRRLPLARLSPEAVARWAGGAPTASAALHARTGGNPFFVSEVLADPGDEVPATVRDAVRARVRRLDEAVRDALDQLAVVPSQVPLSLARALLGDLEVIVPAERAGLLEVRPDALAFRHELARRAIEESVATSRRLRCHARVLAVLSRAADPDPARLVHHAVGAGDDAAVVAHAPAAARAAEQAGATVQAAALHEETLRRGELLAPPDRAAISEAYAWMLFHGDRRQEAVDAAAEAVRLRREQGDPRDLGRALICLALQQWSVLEPAAALRSGEDAVALLTDGPEDAATAFALLYLGVILINVDRDREGLARVDEALGVLTRLGVDGLVPLARIYRGRARMQLGDEGGLDDLQKGAETARAAGRPEHVVLGHLNLVGLLWRLGRYDALERCLDESDVYAEQHEFPIHDRARNAYRHRLAALRGHWHLAGTALEELRDTDDEHGVVDRHVLPGLARLAVRCGRADASELLAAARANAERADSLQALVPTVAAELEHAWLTGAPADVTTARSLLERTATPGREREHGELARWLHRLGEPVAPVPGCPPEYAAGLAGDALAAAAAWERVGDPYERALELAGSGDVDGVREALGVLQHLGAAPAVARTRELLRARGVSRRPRGPQAATRTNAAGLTRRQQEILDLVREGLTNTEIAERLVPSVRTVDHHVSAVLAKLGVTSRRQVAPAGQEEGSGRSDSGSPSLSTSGITGPRRSSASTIR